MKIVDNIRRKKYVSTTYIVKINRIQETDDVLITDSNSEYCYYLEQDNNTYMIVEPDYIFSLWNPTISSDFYCDIPDEPIMPIIVRCIKSPVMEELKYFMVPDSWKPTINEPGLIWIKPNDGIGLVNIEINGENVTANIHEKEI